MSLIGHGRNPHDLAPAEQHRGQRPPQR